MTSLSMADLLAKQETKNFKVSRGQEIEGEIVAANDQELILDLGRKSEGVLPKKDLTPDQIANLKVGDKLLTFVVVPENEHGQVILTLQQVTSSRSGNNLSRWQRFQDALKNNQTFSGKAIESNRGGLVVEVGGIRGFLPSSQVALAYAQNVEKLVGQDINLSVIEVDPNQNRLIFTQKVSLSSDAKEKLSKLKSGEKVAGKVSVLLPFGAVIALEGDHKGLEGLVHVSEVSWDRIEEPSKVLNLDQDVEAKVLSIDNQTGRVNLSIKALKEDPFKEVANNFQPDDVVKGTVTKIADAGISLELKDGVEGFIPSAKIEPETKYEVGDSVTVLVDSIDERGRRVLMAPFLTTTKGLIYK